MMLSETEIKELRIFEDFLNSIGFKRLEGTVFGLLVLSDTPLTSEEIAKTLNLSQSATSTSLKTLAHYGAIETREGRENRAKLHTAKDDSLSIVASIFRKRDQEKIIGLKKAAERLLKTKSNPDAPSYKRLKSIISTSEIAESVMNFIFGLAERDIPEQYPQIIKRLPKAFDLITKSVEPVDILTNSVKNFISSRSWPKSKEDLR
ncbi:MAG: ArsR family transcriptional regulator [Deltaproteobacteria bacterium]|nr:MAG: ArsR family transcriptional regulator [Deltaproteobacteria bacterium]